MKKIRGIVVAAIAVLLASGQFSPAVFADGEYIRLIDEDDNVEQMYVESGESDNEEGTAHYDAETKTLILNGYTGQTILANVPEINIRLRGSNQLNVKEYSGIGLGGYDITFLTDDEATGTLECNKDGVEVPYGISMNALAPCIVANDDLEIRGGTIDVSTGASVYGIYARSLEMNGGNLRIVQHEFGDALATDEGVKFNDGHVSIRNDAGFGINTYGDVDFLGGVIDISANKGAVLVRTYEEDEILGATIHFGDDVKVEEEYEIVARDDIDDEYVLVYLADPDKEFDEEEFEESYHTLISDALTTLHINQPEEEPEPGIGAPVEDEDDEEVKVPNTGAATKTAGSSMEVLIPVGIILASVTSCLVVAYIVRRKSAQKMFKW